MENKPDTNTELKKTNKTSKKSEKITQAIYLASHHIKDNEPLKWELRKESLSLLTCSHSLGHFFDETASQENLFEKGADVTGNSGVISMPTDLADQAFSACAAELISLLFVSQAVGLISRNNAGLIIQEIELLLSDMQLPEKISSGLNFGRPNGLILSEEFFSVDPELNAEINPHIHKTLGRASPGGNIDKEATDKNPNISRQDIRQSIKDKKDSRRGRIIAILRDQPNSTIKDFVKVISDCSEKTIQRELIELVESGIVKRKGERRWSTYYLN